VGVAARKQAQQFYAGNPRVAKLVLNICVGESGDRLQKAAKVGTGPLVVVRITTPLLFPVWEMTDVPYLV